MALRHYTGCVTCGRPARRPDQRRAADRLAARIDAIVAGLQKIETRHPREIPYSLGRATDDLKNVRDQL